MNHIEESYNNESHSLSSAQCLTPMNLDEFLNAEFPPQEMMLTPWLATQSLSMIYAARGIGKTHVSLGIACAVASGGKFLTWNAPEPRHVLLIDGEMTKQSLQQRLAEITANSDKEIAPEALKIIAADAQQNGIPDLATKTTLKVGSLYNSGPLSSVQRAEPSYSFITVVKAANNVARAAVRMH